MNKLEKHIASQVVKSALQSAKLLLAVSGGRDSMILFHSMTQIASQLRLELHVGHFHHGDRGEPIETLAFRDQALKLIQKKCKDRGFAFYFEIYQGQRLKSENALRKFRWLFLKKICSQINCKAIVTAHHREDLLETRILRLLRGVGKQGLPSMSIFQANIFRPLLAFSQKDLYKAYPEEYIESIEDPSNQSDVALRNWIRHRWLPDLEEKYPGATQALSHSLDLLSDNSNLDFKIKDYIEEQGIKRINLENLSSQQKRQVIANYLCQQNIVNYTTSHIFEIQKRLQTPQKDFEFWLLKHRWIVTPFYISLVKSKETRKKDMNEQNVQS